MPHIPNGGCKSTSEPVAKALRVMGEADELPSGAQTSGTLPLEALWNAAFLPPIERAPASPGTAALGSKRSGGSPRLCASEEMRRNSQPLEISFLFPVGEHIA